MTYKKMDKVVTDYRLIDFNTRAKEIQESVKPQNFKAGKLVKQGYIFCLRGCSSCFKHEDDLVIHSQYCDVKYDIQVAIKEIRKHNAMCEKQTIQTEQLVIEEIWDGKSTRSIFYNFQFHQKGSKYWDNSEAKQRKKESMEFQKFLNDLPRETPNERVNSWFLKTDIVLIGLHQALKNNYLCHVL